MTYSLGVIGGLGPKASSFFLNRLYDKLLRAADKDYPDIIMLSASSFADRTKAILTGEHSSLYAQLNARIQSLNYLGVSEIIILCFTMHAIIRSQGGEQEKNLVMLDTFLLNLVKKYRKRTLLLCTKGTMASGLFISSIPEVESLIVMPDAADLEKIHEIIYTIKARGTNDTMLPLISSLVKKYCVDSVVYGCTEFHMLHGLNNKNIDWHVIDPLEEVSNLFVNNVLENFQSGTVSIKRMCEQYQ